MYGITKAMVKQAICDSIIASGCSVSKVTTLDETGGNLRHACSNLGDITALAPSYFQTPVSTVTYYYCVNCGNLYLQRELV